VGLFALRREEKVGALFVGTMCAVMGYGLYHKKRYSLFLVYIVMAANVAVIILGLFVGPEVLLEATIASVPGLLMTIYYHKRRDEFN
jgi:hypothetical protein